jgi:hypothetical protein
MKIGQAFPSKYLKADDFDEATPLTIESVARIEFKDEKSGEVSQKVIIHFDETEKGMICNRTNFRTIAAVIGDEDSDNWNGKRITLYNADVEFKGETVQGIRVKKPKALDKKITEV